MDKVEIKYLADGAKYSQAYSSGVKMTAVSDKNEQVKPFFFCADFFNEMFGAMFTKKKKEIYKFEFDPAKDIHPSMDRTRVLITSDSHDIISKIKNGEKFLNGFEKKIGLEPSKFYPCSEHEQYKDNVILVDADPRVKNTALLLTAWRIALRNSFAFEVKDSFEESLNKMSNKAVTLLGHGDNYQVPKLLAFINYIVEKDKEFIDYFDIANYKLNVDRLHGESGLSQFSNILSKPSLSNETPWEKRVLSKNGN